MSCALEFRYEYVIIDAPPVLPVSDAVLLSTVADGVVVVVGSRHDDARAALPPGRDSCDRQGQPAWARPEQGGPKGPDAYTYYDEGYESSPAQSGSQGKSKAEHKQRVSTKT